MSRKGELHITPETEIQFSESTFQDVHLDDLDFVLDADVEDGEVTAIRIDLTKLVQAMTLYSSMEVFEYDWRAYGKKGSKRFDPAEESGEEAKRERPADANSE